MGFVQLLVRRKFALSWRPHLPAKTGPWGFDAHLVDKVELPCFWFIHEYSNEGFPKMYQSLS